MENKTAEDIAEEYLSEAEKADKALVKPMELAQWVFEAGLSDDIVPEKDELKAKILARIEEFNMAPYYEVVTKKLGWPTDQKLLSKMREENKKKIEGFDKQLEEAKERGGDLDVFDALNAKAAYYMQIGEKDQLLETLKAIPEKHTSTGLKVDVQLLTLRSAFFHMDKSLMKEALETARTLNEQGGDWDRRNRLKVYEGIYCIITRDFDRASELLLSSVATFTTYELVVYSRFIFYTVLSSMLTLNRTQLKAKVVESPDILSVILDVPNLQDFQNALYHCNYRAFFESLVRIENQILRDRYMSGHARWYIREIRVRAYQQFLESYKSVKLESMASKFGVTAEFLDKELSRFIASSRLAARIDKMDGVIYTVRPDKKNSQYQEVVKTGDALLNRVQELARVISM